MLSERLEHSAPCTNADTAGQGSGHRVLCLCGPSSRERGAHGARWSCGSCGYITGTAFINNHREMDDSCNAAVIGLILMISMLCHNIPAIPFQDQKITILLIWFCCYS